MIGVMKLYSAAQKLILTLINGHHTSSIKVHFTGRNSILLFTTLIKPKPIMGVPGSILKFFVRLPKRFIGVYTIGI